MVTVTAEDANFGTVGVFTRQQIVTVFPKLSGEWVALMPAANQTCHPYQGCYCAGAAAQRQLVTGGEVDVVLPRGRYVICHSELTNPMEDSDFTLQAGVGTPPMTPRLPLAHPASLHLVPLSGDVILFVAERNVRVP